MESTISHGSGVVVFGGSGGIGSSIAEQLCTLGHRPFLVSRTASRRKAVEERLGISGCDGDATDEASVTAALATAKQQLGEISAVAVSVGSILLKPAHLTTAAEFEQTLRINLLAPFLVLKQAIPHLKESGGGSILLFSSAAAQIGLANHEAIAAAKAGVIGLTRSAAATYATANIRVNCIAPGLVRTELASKITGNPAAERASVQMHPLGRLGESADIGPLGAWLLSPASTWTTGQVFTVDGGLSSLKVTRPTA